MASTAQHFDAVVIGAGFSGLHMLKSLRDRLGLKARVYEAGETVGGTWYWNRYPGARCDSDAYIYCFTWDKQLLQEWHWSERYPEQPEILRYLEEVAKRHDLKRDIQFKTRVTGAEFDEGTNLWTSAHRQGRRGHSKLPHLSGRHACRPPTCLRSRAWRHSRASGITQAASPIPALTSRASASAWSALAPLQCRLFPKSPSRPSNSPYSSARPTIASRRATARWTPNWSAPERPTMTASSSAIRESFFGQEHYFIPKSVLEETPEERERVFDRMWDAGGFAFWLANYQDMFFSQEANDVCADYIKRKIRKTVKDPVVAEKLIPKGYAYGTKRQPLDTNYYETFNRDNVLLVDAKTDGAIEEITEAGIRAGGKEYPLDIIVFATGFDAMTGPLKALNLKGRGGRTLWIRSGGTARTPIWASRSPAFQTCSPSPDRKALRCLRTCRSRSSSMSSGSPTASRRCARSERPPSKRRHRRRINGSPTSTRSSTRR